MMMISNNKQQDKKDVQLVMLFAAGSWDRQVYRHQQEAFDLLEEHDVPFETIDVSDTSNKAQRNRLWALVTDDYERVYPQFFLRQRDGQETTTFKHFGDIEALQVAASHWTLLQNLKIPESPKRDRTVEPIIDDCDFPVAVVEAPVAMVAEIPKRNAVHHHHHSKEKTKPRRHTMTASTAEKHRHYNNSNKATTTSEAHSTRRRPEKVITTHHHHNNNHRNSGFGTVWSVTDHLDKARASTARLDALVAQAARVRERTRLRSHGESSTTTRGDDDAASAPAVARNFVYQRRQQQRQHRDGDKSSCSHNNKEGDDSVSSGSTSASSSFTSSSSTETSKERPSSSTANVTPNDSDASPASKTEQLEANKGVHEDEMEPETMHLDVDTVESDEVSEVIPMENEEQVASSDHEPDVYEYVANDCEADPETIEASTSDVVQEVMKEVKHEHVEMPVEVESDADVPEDHAAHESDNERTEETDDEQALKEQAVPEKVDSGSEAPVNGALEESRDNEQAEESCNEQAFEEQVVPSEVDSVSEAPVNGALEESHDDEQAEESHDQQAFVCVEGFEDAQDVPVKAPEVPCVEQAEESVDGEIPEEFTEESVDSMSDIVGDEACESESADSEDGVFEDEEQDELGDLAIGGFHESFKLPLTKDTTETTEMESFSNFADSMGSLKLEDVPKSSKEEFVTYEYDEEDDDDYVIEEVVEDDFVENASVPIDKILVLIATQTTDRQVPCDQQNALATLEAHGIEYFTMDGSDPAVKEARNALFELSEIGPQYPQFFHLRGEEVTFLGDMEGLYSAIESQRLGEWLTATLE